MSKLKAGFAKVNINPMMGIPIRGYFKVRLADGILDDIEANALALQFNETITLLISVDNCGIEQQLLSYYRKKVSDATEVPMENIVISSTSSRKVLRSVSLERRIEILC